MPKKLKRSQRPVAELNKLVEQLAAAPDQASGDALRKQILEGFYGRKVAASRPPKPDKCPMCGRSDELSYSAMQERWVCHHTHPLDGQSSATCGPIDALPVADADPAYFRMTKLSGREGASTPVGAVIVGWGRAPAVGESYRVSGVLASSPIPALDWFETTKVVRVRKHKKWCVVTTENSRWRVERLGSLLAAREARDAMRRAREAKSLAQLLSAEGGCVQLNKARAKLNDIEARLEAGEVIAYPTKAGWIVPVWQFRPKGGLLKGLPEVLAHIRAVLPPTDSLFPFTFFLQADPVTGARTPLEALRAGDLRAVLTAVDGFRG